MAICSNGLAWRIPQTEELGGLILLRVTKSRTWLKHTQSIHYTLYDSGRKISEAFTWVVTNNAYIPGGSLVAKSCPTLSTPWIVACQAPLSMGFSRWDFWNGLPFPPPGGLTDPGIKPGSPALQAGSLLTKQFLDEETNENCSVSFSSGNVIIKISSQLECVCVLKSLRSSMTLCDPMDRSLPGSSVHGILQARILEWVAMPSSRGSSWPKDPTRGSYISCIGRQVLYN